MPEDNDEKKPDDLIGEASEDSTAEMDIIKGMFEAGESASDSDGNVFDKDVFSGPGEQEQPVEKPVEEPAPPQAEPEGSPAEAVPPETTPEKSEQDSNIKIVTDDDLKQLFEQSSPGFELSQSRPGDQAEEGAAPQPAPPDQTPAPAESHDEEGPAEESSPGQEEQVEQIPPLAEAGDEPEPDREAAEESETAEPETPAPEAPVSSEARPEEVEEIGIDKVQDVVPPQDEVREEEAGEAPETSVFQDISPDEIVDQLETKAEVGEMTSMPTAKKGDALDKTAELIGSLEPASGDFMNVAELEKLFHNVDILIEWARQISEQMEILEQRLEELIKGRGIDE